MGKMEAIKSRIAELAAEKAEKELNKAADAADALVEKAEAVEVQAEKSETDKAEEAEPKSEPEAISDEDLDGLKAKIEAMPLPEEKKDFEDMSSDELSELLQRANEKKARAEMKIKRQTEELAEADENIRKLEELKEAKVKAEAEAKAKAEAEAEAKAEAATGAVVAGGEAGELRINIVDVRDAKPRPGKAYKYWDYDSATWKITADFWMAKQSSDIWDVIFVWYDSGTIGRELNAEEMERYVPKCYR